MRDRLRELIDLVVATMDERGVDGAALAGRAAYSRDHLDRLVAAATGESPVALRRRLLLERAAWQLRAGLPASEVAAAADYGSAAAFSRAFARAYGMPPSQFAASGAPVELEAPNGLHFHAPAGLVIPGGDATPRRDALDRLLAHHVTRTRELLEACATLPAEALRRPLRPGLVVLAFEGEEPTAELMAERLVLAVEVWVASMAGLEHEPRSGDLLARFDRASRSFVKLVRAIRERDAWDDAFVDALCEPPERFTYGGVVAHVLTFGAIRREHLASVLAELGCSLSDPDPLATAR